MSGPWFVCRAFTSDPLEIAPAAIHHGEIFHALVENNHSFLIEKYSPTVKCLPEVLGIFSVSPKPDYTNVDLEFIVHYWRKMVLA